MGEDAPLPVRPPELKQACAWIVFWSCGSVLLSVLRWHLGSKSEFAFDAGVAGFLIAPYCSRGGVIAYRLAIALTFYWLLGALVLVSPQLPLFPTGCTIQLANSLSELPLPRWPLLLVGVAWAAGQLWLYRLLRLPTVRAFVQAHTLARQPKARRLRLRDLPRQQP